MHATASVPTKNFRWLALLGVTLIIHVLIVAVLIFIATRQVEFIDGQIFLMVALFCLPAVWSVFILLKFRSFAERIVGIIAAVSSLLWLFGIIDLF
jgi:4-amino-4-deoxy-L-arabinose transferase-like glycosyltransferase